MSARTRRARWPHRLVAAAFAVPALLGCAAVAGTAHADTSSPNPLASPTSDDAMLNLLMENGIDYTTSTTPADAASYGGPDSTLVIDSDETDLSTSEIAELANGHWGRVIILGTDESVLAAFAPGINAQPAAIVTGGPIAPRCDQPDASAAGPVVGPAGADIYQLPAPTPRSTASPGSTGSPTATTTPSPLQDVTACYPIGSPAGPGLVSMHDPETGGDVILLGWTDFTQDQYLAEQGDAALALRLFGAHRTLVWLATSFTVDENLGDCRGDGCAGGTSGASPGPGAGGPGGGNPQGGGSGGAQSPTLQSLIPHWIWWTLLQLAIAALALAYWRSRRLGRLVNENLPVKVRAAETVEGHANLYRRASAHGRAAGLLRSAAARRIATMLGLPAGPAGREPGTLVGPLAAHLGRPPERIREILAGDAPMTEAELVELTDQLDRLEQEVRSP
jgi:hypothetical protein